MLEPAAPNEPNSPHSQSSFDRSTWQRAAAQEMATNAPGSIPADDALRDRIRRRLARAKVVVSRIRQTR